MWADDDELFINQSTRNKPQNGESGWMVNELGVANQRHNVCGLESQVHGQAQHTLRYNNVNAAKQFPIPAQRNPNSEFWIY